MLQVSKLYIYPVKSLGGISVSDAEVTDRGFKHDRRWMLVDKNNMFISQREYPQMALMRTAVANNGIEVLYQGQSLLIPFEPQSRSRLNVTVWDDTCAGIVVNSETGEWFSDMLGCNCNLVYMPDNSQRLVDPKYAHQNEITSFADGYPFLLIGEASLNDLNTRLAEKLRMDRFRPNIVFTGGEPYQEDFISKLTINGINFSGVKNCARCVITTIDQQTAEQGKEPIKTLAGYRRDRHKILFGQNVLHKGTGIVSVGDELILP